MRKRPWRGFRPYAERLDGRWLPSGFTPSQIAAAYGLGGISFQSSTGAAVAGDGAGQTIAIVDLYHDPNLQASLDAFDATYHLPKITLNVINQAGSQTDPGWAMEETLDVEWAHAIAPGAAITVVEVSPGTTTLQEFNNTLAAVRTAATSPGVSVVSMSWGYSEFTDETSYDSTFTTPGVTFIAAGGDSGTVSWPASSADVLAVGGTSLRLSSSGGYGSETGWTSAGGGLSTQVSRPSYQDAVQSTNQRSTPDISFDANPGTGVSVYAIPPDSTTGQGTWAVVGGTSLGAPAWAGILAIVNQGRALSAQSVLTGATETLPYLYALPAAAFNKVALSSGGTTSNMAIGSSSYNTQAGLGSPNGAALIDAMVGGSGSSPTPTPTSSPSPSPTRPLGPLPTPHPIPIRSPSPTPTPPVLGPPPPPPPTPTPASTPPPAPPPQPPPRPTTRHRKHGHSTRPTSTHHHPSTLPRSTASRTVPIKKAHHGGQATALGS